jgi:HPt (histidine-containing phosphotransfer) domain-containing protein
MKKLVVDIDKFHEFASGDVETRKEMAELFVDQAQLYLQELLSAHECDEVEEWRDVAHKFKGMAGFAGAVRLRESCWRAQNEYIADRGERTAMLSGITQDVIQSIECFQEYVGS